MKNNGFSKAVLLIVATFSLSIAPALRASTIWTDWTIRTVGTPGSASGSLNGDGVL